MSAFWNKYFRLHGRNPQLEHAGLEEFCRILQQANLTQVLDLGCGSGRHLIALAAKGFYVTGVDHSEVAVELAREWLKTQNLDGEVYLADLHQQVATYERDSFQAIIAVNSLQYVNSETFLKTVKELNRLLATGGFVFLVLPGKDAGFAAGRTEPEELKFSKAGIEAALENHLEIIKLYQDSDKNFVVIAKETKSR